MKIDDIIEQNNQFNQIKNLEVTKSYFSKDKMDESFSKSKIIEEEKK
jgi:hypothetical protein